MRLIDADALRRTHKVAFNGNLEDFANEWVSALAIDEAPTIDAIPIDFIKQTITDKRYILARASEKTAPYYEHAVRALEMLLWEWGKENGKQ